MRFVLPFVFLLLLFSLYFSHSHIALVVCKSEGQLIYLGDTQDKLFLESSGVLPKGSECSQKTLTRDDYSRVMRLVKEGKLKVSQIGEGVPTLSPPAR